MKRSEPCGCLKAGFEKKDQQSLVFSCMMNKAHIIWGRIKGGFCMLIKEYVKYWFYTYRMPHQARNTQETTWNLIRNHIVDSSLGGTGVDGSDSKRVTGVSDWGTLAWKQDADVAQRQDWNAAFPSFCGQASADSHCDVQAGRKGRLFESQSRRRYGADSPSLA